MKEPLVKDKTELPPIVYHAVPEQLFSVLCDSAGNYDGRLQPTWGHNSPYIHTTTTLAILQDRVSGNWKHLPPETKILVLRIEIEKLHPSSKITYADYHEIRYFHVWDQIPAEAFDVFAVKRNFDGTFDFGVFGKSTASPVIKSDDLAFRITRRSPSTLFFWEKC